MSAFRQAQRPYLLQVPELVEGPLYLDDSDHIRFTHDHIIFAVEAQKLLSITLEGSVG